MKLKSILNSMILEVSLKKLKSSGDYTDYAIFDGTNKIGTLSLSISGSTLKIESIYIEPSFRGKGNSTQVLKNCVDLVKSKKSVSNLEWYAVSIQSGNAAIKAFGSPTKIDSIYGNYKTFEDAIKSFGLPQTANTDSDGDIISGEDDAIRLLFKI